MSNLLDSINTDLKAIWISYYIILVIRLSLVMIDWLKFSNSGPVDLEAGAGDRVVRVEDHLHPAVVSSSP